LDGEISIVKKKAGSTSMTEADDKVVLVKLYRGAVEPSAFTLYDA
jgi:hypothetical protein